MWRQIIYPDNGSTPWGPADFDDETIEEDFPAFYDVPDINCVIGSPELGYILLVRRDKILVVLLKEVS